MAAALLQRPVPIHDDCRYTFVYCSFSDNDIRKEARAGKLAASTSFHRKPKVARSENHIPQRHGDDADQGQQNPKRSQRRRYVAKYARKPKPVEAESPKLESSTEEETACGRLAQLKLVRSPSPWPVWSHQLQSLFASECVGVETAHDDQNRLACLRWFRNLPAMSLHGEAAGLSARALAVIALGRTHKDDRLLHQARSAYVNALTLLKQELTNAT